MEQFREAGGPPPGGFDPVGTFAAASARLAGRVGPLPERVVDGQTRFGLTREERQRAIADAEQKVADATEALQPLTLSAPTSIEAEHARDVLDAAKAALATVKEQGRQAGLDAEIARVLRDSPRIARAFATGDQDILRAVLGPKAGGLGKALEDAQVREFSQGAASFGVSGESQQSVLAIGADREPRIGVNLTEHTRTFVNELGVTVTEPLKELEEGEEGPGILRRTAAQEEEFGGPPPVVPEPATPPAAPVPTLAEQVALDEAEAERKRLELSQPRRLGGRA